MDLSLVHGANSSKIFSNIFSKNHTGATNLSSITIRRFICNAMPHALS
jgi:hypothetical protein